VKLTRRFAAISAAAITAVVVSAGGAQAQGSGGILSLLGQPSLVQVPYGMGQGDSGDTRNNTNNNTNNNTGGVNNNNNNNNNGDGAATNNNNNNNNVFGGVQNQGGGGLLGFLGIRSLVQVCYPIGQVGHRNTFTGNQNINCNQT
jgi:hypothetical protein